MVEQVSISSSAAWFSQRDPRKVSKSHRNGSIPIPGDWVFAAGVTAGIDGALRLAAELRGDEAAQAIQLHMVYAPEPPFNSCTPEKAPATILAQARQAEAGITNRREATTRRVATRMGIQVTAATPG